MVASYVEGWRQKCLTTDARFIALEVRRWFRRPRIEILYPVAPLDDSMFKEMMEKMQKSMLLPELILLNKNELDQLKELGSSGTTLVASLQK